MQEVQFAPGVVLWHFPGEARLTYVGAGDALVAAGVVQRHQFPGQPGSGATSVTWAPNGARARRGYGERGTPGWMQIHLRHTTRNPHYVVTVAITEERSQELEVERQRAAFCWPFPCSAHVERSPA